MGTLSVITVRLVVVVSRDPGPLMGTLSVITVRLVVVVSRNPCLNRVLVP